MEKKTHLRRYLVAGLLIWVPLIVTLLVLRFLVDLIDQSLTLLPKAYQPDNVFGMHIPGLGLVFTLVVVFVTGVLVTNYFGNRLVNLWERLLNRIPLVRSIYTAVKQVVNTLFSSTGESFRRVLLVQYPREGIWSIAFQTSTGFGEGDAKVAEDLVTVFIPTTPNPTSGFLLMIPKKDTTELEISVDEALKMVISLGVVLPKDKKVEQL